MWLGTGSVGGLVENVEVNRRTTPPHLFTCLDPLPLHLLAAWTASVIPFWCSRAYVWKLETLLNKSSITSMMMQTVGLLCGLRLCDICNTCLFCCARMFVSIKLLITGGHIHTKVPGIFETLS